MSTPNINPAGPAAAAPSFDTGNENSPARSGSFHDQNVAIVASDQQQQPAKSAAATDNWKEARPAASGETPGTRELSDAISSASKQRGLVAKLRNIIKAIIKFFTGAGSPAQAPLEKVASTAAKSSDLQTVANTGLLRQLDTANRGAAASINTLNQPLSATKMADLVASDPSLLRNITAPATSLANLTQPGAAEKIIAAHNLPADEQSRLSENFREAAGLLDKIYQARFRPAHPNTAFANFGSAENNPYQQLAEGHGLSMEADSDLRDWLQLSITYADRAAVAMLETAEGSESQIDLGQLSEEVEKFLDRPPEA